MKMSRKNLVLTYLLAGCLSPSIASAEDGAIAPDRPGLSTGTYTVAPGYVYLEAGYQYEFNRSGADTATQTLPQLVMRTGITEDLEINFMWDGWNKDHMEGLPNETSRADLTIGSKYRIVVSEQYNVTLIGLVSIPVGSEPSTSDNADPLVGLMWDYSLSDSVELFGGVQTTQIEDDDENAYLENQIGLGLGFEHTDRLSSFVEYFGVFPDRSQEDEQHIIDGGLTYLYSDDIQLDISAGVGLNEATSHFISLGVAYRF